MINNFPRKKTCNCIIEWCRTDFCKTVIESKVKKILFVSILSPSNKLLPSPYFSGVLWLYKNILYTMPNFILMTALWISTILFGKWSKFRKSLNVLHTFWPGNSTFRKFNYSKEIVQAVEKAICMMMFITALFIIFKEKEATLVSMGVN